MNALFSVGDVVRVKSLEQLKVEFGEYIDVPSNFVESMYDFCGSIVVVKEVYRREDDGLFSYILEEDEEGWYFDECVLELSYSSEQVDRIEMGMSFDDIMSF